MSNFRFEAWPTEFRKITQHFGANAQYYSQFDLPGHEGVDLRAPTGSKIFCVAAGRVYRVHKQPDNHNYGIHVRVQHQDGYKTVYGHMEEAFVEVGQNVKAGELLGLADNTGNSFGSHLHLILKKQGAQYQDYPYNIIDPTPFLLPLLSWTRPAGPYVGGWMLSTSLSVSGELAQVHNDGALLRIGPKDDILVPAGTLVILAGDEQKGFLPVQVSSASVGALPTQMPSKPADKPPVTIMTIPGWAWGAYLDLHDDQAIVNTSFGINLRTEPSSHSKNIGVIRRASTVTVTGRADNGYLPIDVRRIDFVGPVDLPAPPPEPVSEPVDTQSLPDGVYLGWVEQQFLRHAGIFAHIPHRTIMLKSEPNRNGRHVATIRGDATVTLAGHDQDGFTPVLVDRDSLLRLATPIPDVNPPQPFSTNKLAELQSGRLRPLQRSQGGWVLTGELRQRGGKTFSDANGLNLRQDPQRNATIVGYVPGDTPLFVTDEPQGEFTPVRIAQNKLQPPIYNLGDVETFNPDPQLLGQTRIGLHASADPLISEAEHAEFGAMRPGAIKVLSFHAAHDIARLARAHSGASWIVRAFLEFGGRKISPADFLRYTLPDVKRSLAELHGKDVVVELHNEPNLKAEGWGKSWQDGADFNRWWLELLELYRRELPNTRFIFPGLSPGYSISNLKIDHVQFAEASREAIEAADGLGIHLYWSNVYPMSRTLSVLDDYIGRFRFKPIWVTEASHNKGGASPATKAQQYLDFWHELQKRPLVHSVTYFVASASNSEFAEEVWVGRGMGDIIGRR